MDGGSNPVDGVYLVDRRLLCLRFVTSFDGHSVCIITLLPFPPYAGITDGSLWGVSENARLLTGSTSLNGLGSSYINVQW